MDIDTVPAGDAPYLDTDLLQLPEFSPYLLKANPQLPEDLFSQWLSLPDTCRLVKSLIDDGKAGKPFNLFGLSGSTNAGGGNSLPSMFPGGSGPPLSPRSSSGSPRLSKQKTSLSSLRSPSKLIREPLQEFIPQFYFQNGRPPADELKEQCLSTINQIFSNHPNGLQIDEFKPVAKGLCKLPSFLSYALFRKIDLEMVTRDAFIQYWVDGNMLAMDLATCVFNILKQPENKYLTQADFRPVLRELLATHPGLEFLQGTPEFQERYGDFAALD